MPNDEPNLPALSRRRVLAHATALGLAASASASSTQEPDPQKEKSAELQQRAADEFSVPAITADSIAHAARIVNVPVTADECRQLERTLTRSRSSTETLRKIDLPNGVVPALVFDPTLGDPAFAPTGPTEPNLQWSPPNVARPRSEDDIAFLPLTALASLVRSRQISSVALTKLYLDRLMRYDPVLKCVVTLTPELALRQAEQADREIAAGRYRGPLHGIPWGAKDLIAYPGFTTTWGAEPFRKQSFPTAATVARRMDDAGAVLVAKLTLGALAEGDRWFGGVTRNPWNVAQGSSGSSAGSASAVVAGLVGFALGSETLGSIVSPCRRCGASGLRPTFGRVSRYGCMTLSWSMDKIGPICRSIEDTALVFAALLGADGLDPSVVEHPFTFPLDRDLTNIRVGYFEGERGGTATSTLDVLKKLNVKLVPITLPRRIPADLLVSILGVEAASAFDETTRQRKFQGLNNWPNTFLKSRFVSAVDYLQANRLRTLLIKEMNEVMRSVDLYVGGNDLVITNLTGHPTAVLPNGFVPSETGVVPTSITFTAGLYKEAELISVAHAYQQATGHHLRRPPQDQWLKKS